MCTNCKDAGKLLGDTPYPDMPEIRQNARNIHALCKGGTHCTCQHRVPLSAQEKQEASK